MTKKIIKMLNDFKFNVGDYVHSDLTQLYEEDCEDITVKKAEMIKEGIGCAIKVKTPENKTQLAILEDFDFTTDKSNPRYIFRIFDKDCKPMLIDTLYDNNFDVLEYINKR